MTSVLHDTLAPRERDPNVVLPRDVKVTIKRGRAAYSNATRGKPSRSKKTEAPRAIISIIDPEDHRRREKLLKISKRRAKGRRGQPPMTDRLRVVAIYVDHLERQGVRFATARSSVMNREVRKFLNERMSQTKDKRKSRRGTTGDDAVSDLLNQVAELRK